MKQLVQLPPIDVRVARLEDQLCQLCQSYPPHARGTTAPAVDAALRELLDEPAPAAPPTKGETIQ
jgi:hypothetical protein